MGGSHNRPAGRELAELPVEERHPGLVERRERLVQNEQVGLVQEGAAEREPLRHPTRVGGDELAPSIPEPEPLEQHPDPLATLGDAVETAEQIEVLERGELAVDERLVRQEPDAAAVDVDLDRAARRGREPREQAQQRRLPGSVCSFDNEKAASLELERDACKHAPPAEPLLQSLDPDHASVSAATNAKKTRLITPLTVKNAASRRRRSPGRTRECSYTRRRATAATPDQ